MQVSRYEADFCVIIFDEFLAELFLLIAFYN